MVPGPAGVADPLQVLRRADEEAEASSLVLDELRTMGMVAGGAQVVWEQQATINGGFPAPTLVAAEATERLRAQLQELPGSVTVVGRGGGDAFFTSDVLRRTRDEVARIVRS